MRVDIGGDIARDATFYLNPETHERRHMTSLLQKNIYFILNAAVYLDT